MNRVFKHLKKDFWYRDHRVERGILIALGILIIIALLALFLKPTSRELPVDEDFMNLTFHFFQDSVQDMTLIKADTTVSDSAWLLFYEYPEGKSIVEDLVYFGLFCGEHVKRCSVQSDSMNKQVTLTVLDGKGNIEGRILLHQREEKIKGKILLIIDDFGYIYGETEKEFLALNTPLTFSIIPGHPYTKKIAHLALQKGHSVIIHMPMEPIHYRGDEEEYILMDGMDLNEIDYRISKAIAALPMAKGMNNHMGSRVTQSLEMMHKIAHVLEKNNLFFVDSYTTNKTVIKKVLQAYDIPVYERDIFIDHEYNEASIRRQVDKMAKIAEKKGLVVAIGHNRPMTAKILSEKIPILEKEGFKFITPGDV
ncbi:MAG: divergent polysaccharide deacetylase family protein [Candidatus Marinimicrobia bacterium]|nr:divergent polysaccharide deacetylase family protein [Candidatus Neomarinimicrobiota bacterium]